MVMPFDETRPAFGKPSISLPVAISMNHLRNGKDLIIIDAGFGPVA